MRHVTPRDAWSCRAVVHSHSQTLQAAGIGSGAPSPKPQETQLEVPKAAEAGSRSQWCDVVWQTHPSSGPRHRRTPFRPLCRDLEPLSGPWGSHGGQLGVHNNRPVWKPGANTDPGLAPVTCAGPPSRGVTSSPARPEPPRAVGGGGVGVGPTAPQIDSPGTAHLLGLPGRTPILTALTSAHSSDVGRRSEPCGWLRLQAGSPLPGGPSVLSIKNRLQLMGRGSHTAGDASVTQSQASAHKPHPETPSQPHPGRVWPAAGRVGWPG